MSETFDSVIIYTDGACSGNPGPGGWGAVVALPNGFVQELGGGHPSTTNNRMELAAIIHALQFVNQRKEFSKKPVKIFTDSTYAIRGITQWIWGWKRRGWKNAEGGEVLNQDQWEELLRQVQLRGSKDKIEWHYSRGHVGTPGNERCDEIAVAFSKNSWVDLYSGPLLKYPISIHDHPENTELPEMRPKTEKKAAFSYLSLVGGQVWRHRDWGSCERRVKGQSGAKFKKALSAEDEKKILKEWGLSDSAFIQES